MEKLHVALALSGALVISLGLVSGFIKRMPFSEQLVAVLYGVLIGPVALGWLEPASWGRTEHVVIVATRVTLAIGLMGVALRIEHETLKGIWRPVALLLALGMFAMWLVSALAVGAWLEVGLWTALMIGAVVTPTDPIIASTLVTGPVAEKNLPLHLRQSLSLESGSNDGLAYLLVMLPIMVMQHENGPAAIWDWLWNGLILDVLFAVVIGIVMGGLAAVALRWARGHKTVEIQSLLSYTVALSLATLGIAKIFGTDALIAVFAAGLAFNLSSDVSQQHEEENIQETVNRLFTIPVFILLGALLPWREWAEIGWPLFALVLTVLLLRRPLAVLVLATLLRRRYLPRDLAFLGWFGPIGIAALFYAATAWEKTGDPMAWHATTAVIFGSLVAHGVSAAPLTYLYGRRSEKSGRE